MTRGNHAIAAEGTRYAAQARAASRTKIEAAKARIKDRVLRAETRASKLTIAAVLEEAGLNRLYLEGKNRKADKQALKDWLASARTGFVPPTEAPPSRRLEDRFEVLKGEFLRLQNASVVAHLQHVDCAQGLAEAQEEIRRLKAVEAELTEAREAVRKLEALNAKLRRTVEAHSIGH